MLRSLVFLLAASVTLACDAGYKIWIPRHHSADPLYRFVKDGKAGYIDVTGRVVIPPTLPASGNGGSEFHDGLLEIAESDGKYVDRTGKLVIDKDLYRGWEFSEGLAVAMRQGDNLWGYIDVTGEFAISPRFATYPNGYVYPFSDGLAMVQVKDKFGYIDRSGAFAIAPQFLDGTRFRDGMARVVTEGPCMYYPEGACGFANPVYAGGKRGGSYPPCKFTYIDKTGHAITPKPFDGARDFSEDLAPVLIGGTWGFIDKRGSLVIAPKFENAYPFSSGLARIQANGLYGYADKSGKIVIAPQYKYAENFSGGFAVVGDPGGPYRYIDQYGDHPIEGEFAAASPFFKGLANVMLLESDPADPSVEFAYIDTKGRRVFTY